MTPDRSWADVEELVDVVVVGLGVAGTVAAIEAAERGAQVVAIDRWGRGGASARSGGVLYAGGGTEQQRAAGFDDDPEQMRRYLSLEEGVPLDDRRLHRFCDRSLEDHGWLITHGVSVPMGFDPAKTVVPVDDSSGLYYSGNEKHYATKVPAVPRGHRVAGAGMTGHDLVAELHRAAAAAGVDMRAPARLVDLAAGRGRVHPWGRRARPPKRPPHPPAPFGRLPADRRGRGRAPARAPPSDHRGGPPREAP